MRFDSIHNYYETLVVREIIAYYASDIKNMDEDYLQDVACLALNMLPSRYVRHDVDMAFFLTSSERDKIDQMVTSAVESAVEQASKYKGDDERPNTIDG
ncbi:MAG: late competence development ComFB family protein [Gammaproteobacteria bacterium]|nr:late competence development ComFB family protein [Gammaproteobacteria bacterium]